MKKDSKPSDHLINNLCRISSKNSIFNYKSGQKAFLSYSNGDVNEWLKTLLPNTRLILEPNIIGTNIALQYINGKLNKSIDDNSEDITDSIINIEKIPKLLPIKKRIEMRGILYHTRNKFEINNETELIRIIRCEPNLNKLRFCAIQIFNCNLNHFQSLQELKNLCFEIPQTHFTKFVSDIQIYHQCWKEGKLFTLYPTNGIVLKINSKKFQKYLGENDLFMHWAFAINR